MITKLIAIYAALLSTIMAVFKIIEFRHNRLKRKNEDKVLEVSVHANVIYVNEPKNKGPYIVVQITNLTSEPVTITKIGLADLKPLKRSLNKFTHDAFCASLNAQLDWKGSSFPCELSAYGTVKLISAREDLLNELKYRVDPPNLIAIRINHTRSRDVLYVGLTQNKNETIRVVAREDSS